MTAGSWRVAPLLLVVIAMVTTGVTSQQLYSCPLQWMSNRDSCYLFVFDKTKTYQEAATDCWGQGAGLVSVNDYSEMSFLTGFLENHARETATMWYTSGQYISGAIKWYGDGTYTNKTDDTEFWHRNFRPDLVDDRIVFRFSAQYLKFKWDTVSGMDPYYYICEIPKSEVFRIVQQNRDFDYGMNGTDKSQIQHGPKFLVTSQDLVVVGKNWPAVIECEASGKPQPTFQWYKLTTVFGTQNFGHTTQVKSTKRYTLTGGRMTITDPTEQLDGGVFQCKAESKFGSIITSPIRLSFGYLEQFSPNTRGAVMAKKNTGSYINCMAPSAKPGLVYNWYRDNAMNFVRPELNKYMFLSGNGNLYFSEVQDNDAGDYYCVVTLVSGFGAKLSTPMPPSRTSKAIRLIVANNTAQEYGPIIHPDFISVYPKPPMVGAEVRMECFAFGRLPMRYSWSRNDKPLPDGVHFKYDNRILMIPKAKLADSGNYTCKVEKLVGLQRDVSKSFILTLEAKPYFVVPLRNMHADVESTLTWRCEVEAIPRATYSWYKNSQLLQRVPGEIEIRENVLVINRLNADRDNGMYQCMATNSHGTSMSSAQLRVLAIKPTFAKYPLPTSLVASQGGNLTIRCTPEAAPEPDITWMHNGGAVGGGRAEVLLDGTLLLSQVNMGDQGVYTCKAQNLYGESQSSTRVMVYRGLKFVARPRDTVGKVNTTVFLYCEISYDYNSYDLAYIWKFNGRIIDTHKSLFFRQGEKDKMGLYIINAQYYHTGEYTCIGQSVTTSISESAHVRIIGSPGEPAGVFVEARTIQNSTLKLVWTWNPHANHGYPVTHFEVVAWTEYTQRWEIMLSDIPVFATQIENSIRPMRHVIQVNDLQPHNSYRFRVRAKNMDGVGPASKPSSIYRVPAAAPRVAPSNVGGGGGVVGLLCMRWNALRRDQEGGEKFGYIVFWKLAGEKRAVPKQQDVGNTTRYCTEVGEKMYYVMYAVQVQAYNEKGLGPNSQTSFAFSAEGMPEVRPTNVKYIPINSTAVYVTWDKVPNTREAVKGKVAGYEIHYWKAESNETKRYWFYRSYVYCDCGRTMIIGLQPNTRYWVRVVVFTSAGRSVPSEKYLAITYLAPASEYPQFVNVYSHAQNSVKVVWRGVNINIGEDTILGYRIIYWQVGADIRTANSTTTDSPRENEAIVYKLQQDTIYCLRVMAINRGGDGMKSNTLFFSILRDGAISINRANFDPSHSQVMVAGNRGHSWGWSWVTVTLLLILSTMAL